MLVVLDTNVVVAAMRSPSGASAELLRRVRLRQLFLAANVALALEYEAICSLTLHVTAAGLLRTEVDIFIDAVIAMCEPVETHFLWRPQLRDPADEFVLEAAVNGRAEAIVTFNKKDFIPAAKRFGINLYAPGEVLRILDYEKP